MNLQPLTWPEAHKRRLATARAFAALGIPAGTIRRWASQGLLTAQAKAPGGAHLYAIAEVSDLAETMNHKPRAKTLANHTDVMNTW